MVPDIKMQCHIELYRKSYTGPTELLPVWLKSNQRVAIFPMIATGVVCVSHPMPITIIFEVCVCFSLHSAAGYH